MEPPVVPRFLAALQQAGATPVRVDSYVTTPGATAEQCAAEAQQLQQGHVHAVAFSSTAEVCAPGWMVGLQGAGQLSRLGVCVRRGEKGRRTGGEEQHREK